MLYLVGLGLGDPKDITLKGLEIVKKSTKVYLEAYTSIICPKEELEAAYEKSIELADRTMMEEGTDSILNNALENDVTILVVGDPFGATTHTDIILRAREKGIQTQVVHNASILNAVGCTGLQLYSFGETVSIPFWTTSWKPDSFFDKICENKKRGLHTLCLLDIKVKEPNLDSMMKGKIVYDPPRFMTVAQAADQLTQIIKEHTSDILSFSDLCIGVARIGSTDQKIKGCSIEEMVTMDLGPPLHSLIIPGNLHPLETDFLSIFKST